MEILEKEMNSKNKEGITLIFLAIIVVVMGIIAGIVGYGGIENINETKLLKFANELKSLEVLTAEYKLRNNGELDFIPMQLNTSTFDEEKLFQFAEETIEDNTLTLYRINMNKIDAVNTMFGNGEAGVDDIYVVSSTTGNVYYLMGYTLNDETYYTLTDNLKDLI